MLVLQREIISGKDSVYFSKNRKIFESRKTKEDMLENKHLVSMETQTVLRTPFQCPYVLPFTAEGLWKEWV